MQVGPIAGVMGAMLIVIDTIFLLLIEWYRPAEDIEPAVSFPCPTSSSCPTSSGDSLSSSHPGSPKARKD